MRISQQALKKLLANYHTTIRRFRTPAADAALVLATSATPASRCSCCGRAPRRSGGTGLACRQGQSLGNKSRCLCLIGFHAKLSTRPAGQRDDLGIRTHNWLRYIPCINCVCTGSESGQTPSRYTTDIPFMHSHLRRYTTYKLSRLSYTLFIPS